MKLLQIAFSWKVLFSLLYGALALLAILISYYWLTGVYDQVDGGLIFVVALMYLLGLAGFILVIHVLKKLTSRHPKRQSMLRMAVLICIVAVVGMYILQSIVVKNGMRYTTLEGALEYGDCTVSSLDQRSFSPPELIVTYKNQETTTLPAIYSPRIYGTLLQDYADRCGEMPEFSTKESFEDSIKSFQ